MLLEHIRRDVSPTRSFPAETLYHKDVGFPSDNEISFPQRFSPIVKLRYGPHATDAALTDKYSHNVTLPKVVNLTKGTIFEIGVVGRTITKVCIRQPYDDKFDISLVISTQNGHVRSIWLNRKDDTHKTLDTSKYAVPRKR